MTYVLGLTGSIGMGKTTTAQIFRDLGHPVWDADQAVHRLYAAGGQAVAPVSAAFPGVLRDGGVDRALLRQALAANPQALATLEGLVHPLVAQDRQRFLEDHANAPLVVLDIPLLFESAARPQLDGIAVVSTDPATQRDRVLGRPGMTEDVLAMILARQMPDRDKRARADWVIPTDTPAAARAAVDRIIEKVVPHA